MTKLHDLFNHYGQSIWLDYISRDLLTSGQLARLIDQGLRGLTSNPTIFDQAISGSTSYDQDLTRRRQTAATAFAAYDAISQADVGAAADALRPLYEASGGADGLASIEVNPDLADDAASTVAEAQRLWASLGRPNIMVKVPATPAGVVAIRDLIGEGININATLMFSLAHYDAVAFAYIEGLEDFVGRGGDPARVASVASFFVSRIDGVVDKQLAAAGNTDLLGKIAIANAKLAYRRFGEVFSGPRWQALAARGARYQRPLWASTSTKNPAYPDLLYVDNLIGPHTVNTLPLATVEATFDHGQLGRTVDAGVDEAQAQIDALAALGIDFASVTAALQTAGVKSFAQSFHHLLDTIAGRMAML
ncbi:MAG: transaldolase [Caldilineales bacterium]|nr:transaldolase [Caldilineales bacterium]MCW5859845.1 transaldolase [Caldilineales bacterium]